MNWQLTASEWFVVGFWVLAGLAIILGIAISAEDWITEKLSSHGDK